MATRSKRRSKRRSVAELFEQARRSLAKGHFKQALKDAKLCHRQQPDAKTHQLLQRAYLARARELHRSGLRGESRAAAENLLGIGVTDSSVQQELPELLVALGMFDRAGSGGGSGNGSEQPAAEVDSLLMIAAADHAVLRPDEAPASMPGIRRGALRIRSALAAVEAGREAGREADAFAPLKEIARGSPFADWKYFVRGLAAYYREDMVEMRANWERLDRGRFAARIAAPLRALADPDFSAPADPQLVRGIKKLGEEVLGGPVLARLDELRNNVAATRWSEVLRSLRKAQKTFERFDPALLQRIAEVVYPSMVHRGVEAWLVELTSLMTPPPIDPKWNRARAMVCERSSQRSVDEDEARWMRYIEDLAGLACLRPEERTLAQALVWLRLGRNFVDEGEASPGFFGPPKEYVQRMQARAVECFGNAVKLAPHLRSAHQTLAEARVAWEQPDRAAEAYRRLLEQFPEDLDSLRFLAVDHQRRDEPFEAREYALRAQRLRPLDRTLGELVWATHVAAARHHALREEWEKGRAELEAAEKLTAQNTEPYHLLVCRAALEFKAGELGLGHRLVDRARSEAGHPAPVLLYLTIQAIRYALLKAVADEFECRWIDALKKKCSSGAADRMCKILTAYMPTEVDYPGRVGHVGHLLVYLRRCSRVKWQADALRSVCTFLDTFSDDDDLCDELYDKLHDEFCDEFCDVDELLEKFIQKGCRTFPEYPYFHYMTGELEFREGPMACDRLYASECFERALELAKDSAGAEDAEVVEKAKRRLTFLGEMAMGDSGPSGGSFGGPLPDFHDDESSFDEDEEFDSDDDEFDSDEDPFSDRPPGRVLAAFMAMCRSMGCDPKEMFDRVAKGMPLPVPLRLGKAASPAKQEKRKKR